MGDEPPAVIRIVHDITAPRPAARDVAECLRGLADRIDAGSYGECIRAAVVLRCARTEPLIFGMGDTSPEQTFMDLHAGATQLLHMQSPERT